MPARVNRGSVGNRYLEDMMDGCDGPWGKYNVWPAQADCVLAMLELPHMHVSFMIDPKCDVKESEPQIRHVIM